MTATEVLALELMDDFVLFGYSVSEAAQLASNASGVTPARILLMTSSLTTAS